ncbi:MAG: hypothetical protein N4A61_01160 [Pelagimonas sp.]|jgi:hypothetical protein|nr:hypothetical protein [Pelagimonas sp.]
MSSPTYSDADQMIELVQTDPGRAYFFNFKNAEAFSLSQDTLSQVSRELNPPADTCLTLYAPIFYDPDNAPYLLTSGLRDPRAHGGRVTFVTDREDRFYERVPENNLAEFRFGGGCAPVFQASEKT